MKIAILITCNDASEFVRSHPDDGEKFRELMSAVRPGWEYCPLHVSANEFPESVDDFDGYVVCGSSASVHDGDDWISRLLNLIRQIDSNGIPLFGCCFGHQAIAKALGGEVARNDFGWSAGTETTRFVRVEDWMPTGGDEISLYSFHHEQVSRLPAGCRVVGTNPICPISSFARGDHVFTTQYHPEMPKAFAKALVEEMESDLGDGLADARTSVEGGAQGPEFASWIARFLEFAHVSRTTRRRGTPDPVAERHDAAIEIARLAGAMALRYFRQLPKLHVESKGPGDFVSEADRNVEQLVRAEIGNRFPEDGIVGEEFGGGRANSSFTWVIDPIDGTTNFVSAIHAWCVSIACVRDSTTVVGVIHDPVHNEMHHCRRNRGTFLNGTATAVSRVTDLADAHLGVGFSSKFRAETTLALFKRLLNDRVMFSRTGSGALGLAHVASGRHDGFIEEHQNVWDCIAGLLLVEEAGGMVLEHDPDQLLEAGGRIAVANPFVFEAVRSIATDAFGSPESTT